MPAGKKWSSTEDEALSRAWAQSTANSAKVADQTSAALRGRIKQHFERLAAGHQRSLNALRNRWTDIQHDGNIFCGCFEQVRRQERSGSNDVLDVEAADAMYLAQNKRSFEYHSCWLILRDCPKFQADDQQRTASPSAGRPMCQKRAKESANEETIRRQELHQTARLADAMQRLTRIIEEQFVLGLFNQPTPDHPSGKRYLELLRAKYLRMAEAEVVQGESGTPDVENAGESGSEGQRREDAPRKRVRREISLGESALVTGLRSAPLQQRTRCAQSRKLA